MGVFDSVSTVRPYKIWDGAVARAVGGERLTFAVVDLEPNRVVPEHQHPNEQVGLVLPQRAASGYRRYGLAELNRLRSLRELLDRFGIDVSDVVLAARLRRDTALRTALDGWLASRVNRP